MNSPPLDATSKTGADATGGPASQVESNDDSTRIISPAAGSRFAVQRHASAVVSPPTQPSPEPTHVPTTDFTATRVVPAGTPLPQTSITTGSGLLAVGTRVAEFEITRLIGQGGFGVVYEAWDHTLERVVALKEYMPSSLANRQGDGSVVPSSERHKEAFDMGMRSFINEARLLAQFDHPALLKVYRFWQERGTTYLVMPCYRGDTLKEALASKKDSIDQNWLMGIVDGVTQALAVMHRANCYHRDIAPDNIMLLEHSGLPVVLDFGAARRVIADMTQAITVILKPGYAPIEQYAETPDMSQGAWTDIYALSAVMHVVISGRSPPPSVARMLNDRYVPLAGNAELQKRFANHILAAVDSGLAVRPEGRPQSITEFRVALDLMNVSEAIPVRPVLASAPERPSGLATPAPVALPPATKKVSVPMLATAAVALAVASIGAWWWSGNTAPNSASNTASNSAPSVSAVAQPSLQAAAGFGQPVAPPPTAPSTSPAAPTVRAVNASQSLNNLSTSGSPGFEVSAKPGKPEARIGIDKLGFQIQSSKPGFVYVYMLSSGGDLLLLFPNALDKRNRIEAGAPLSLPKPSWAMDAGGPPGTDEFVVVVSEHERNLKASGIQYEGVFGQIPTKLLEALESTRGSGPAPLLGMPVCPSTGVCNDNYGTAGFKIIQK